MNFFIKSFSKINRNDLFEFSFFLFVLVSFNNEFKNVRSIWWITIFLYNFLFCLSFNWKIHFHLSKFKIWALCFFSICLISLGYSLNKQIVIDNLMNILIILIVCFTLDDKINSYNDLIKFIYIFVLGIYIDLLYVLFTFDLSLFRLAQIGYASTGVWNGNEVALDAFITIPFLLFALDTSESKYRKIFYLVSILIPVYLIYMTSSRKGFICLVLSFCLYIIFKKPKKIIRNICIIIIFCCSITWAIFEVPILYETIGWRMNGFFNLISGSGKIDSSTFLRKKYIDLGLKYFRYSPLFGYGLSNFSIINFIELGKNTYSHNNFIEILIGTGLLGFISYYSIYFYEIQKFIKMLINHKTLFLTKVIFIEFIIFLLMHFALVTYISVDQWLLLLFLYHSLKFVK